MIVRDESHITAAARLRWCHSRKYDVREKMMRGYVRLRIAATHSVDLNFMLQDKIFFFFWQSEQRHKSTRSGVEL